LCPAGKTSFQGSLKCQVCEKGKYASAHGSDQCQLCKKEIGEYANKVQSTKCLICPKGKTSTVTDVCTTATSTVQSPAPAPSADVSEATTTMLSAGFALLASAVAVMLM
jgi:hypothetical protein